MINHLALIMDGNRRWAKKQGLLSWQGHQQGAKNIEMVLQYCLKNNIKYVSLYALSIENLQRSKHELSYLFSLVDHACNRLDEFIKHQVRVRFVGDRTLIPAGVIANIDQIEHATESFIQLECNILFCYGGQQDIIAAAQSLLLDRVSTHVTINDFKARMWTAHIPDPELIIRTGGMRRLSNFFLLQAAYSEIHFLDCLWPDFNEDLLDKVIKEAIVVFKNFGK